MSFEGFTFDDKVVAEIDRKCAMVNAHDYNDYLHNSSFGGNSIIDTVKEIRASLSYIHDNLEEVDLDLSVEAQIKIVIEFFKSFDAELGKLVESLLTGKDKRFEINISNCSGEPSGNVATYNNSKNLHLNVKTDGTVHGLRILAHEVAHAISGFKTQSYAVLNSNNPNEEQNFFHHLGQYDVDSIGEIESHIIELLFMEYLLDKDMISQKDYQKFLSKRNNSTLNNCNTIIEESYILDNIPKPMTLTKINILALKMGGLVKTKKYSTIMNRLIFMFQRQDNSGYSEYDFRYIVGEVVSKKWLRAYDKSNHQEKEQMKRDFKNYLLSTHKQTLSSACQNLLNRGIGETFNSYISTNELTI